MKKDIFKKGVVVRHLEKGSNGIVIDWGIFNRGYKKFILANKELSDSVRVWTKDGRIEVWPALAVRAVEN